MGVYTDIPPVATPLEWNQKRRAELQIPQFLKHIYNTGVWSRIELASMYTVPLSAVNGLRRLTTTSN